MRFSKRFVITKGLEARYGSNPSTWEMEAGSQAAIYHLFVVNIIAHAFFLHVFLIFVLFSVIY